MSIIEPSDRTMGPEPTESDEQRQRARDEAGRFAKAEAEAETPAEDPDTFDRAYVEQLRDEAARYRTRARDYENTFDGYDEETRAGWLELISMAKAAEENPDVQWQLATMLGFEIQPGDVEAIEEVLAEDKPLTRDEMMEIARQEARSIYEQEQAARDEQQAIDSVKSQAKALGYEADSPEYVLLLRAWNEDGVNSAEEAHARVQEWEHQKFEEYLARKQAEAGNSPVAPSGNGVSPSIVNQPLTWESARDSMHERLSNL